MTSKSVLTAVGLVVVAAAGFSAGSWYMKARIPAPATAPVVENTVTPPPAASSYSLYLVALSDNGKSGKMIGCGDSLVPVGAQAQTVSDALTALFAIKTQYYGQSGLETSLNTSTLKVDKAVPGRVDLSGSFQLGGTCDDPRAEEQINATVHQFPGYETATVYVNGKTLSDSLSSK